MAPPLKLCGNCINQIERLWPSCPYCGHTNPTWGRWSNFAEDDGSLTPAGYGFHDPHLVVV